MARRHARQRSRRADRREQVQTLAERDVDAAEPRADGGRDRSLDRDPRGADRLEGLLGQQVAMLLEGRGARHAFDPLDRGDRGIEHEPGGCRHLWSDAVAGDQRDPVACCHASTYARRAADVGRVDERAHQGSPRGRSNSNQTHAPSTPDTRPHRSATLLRRCGLHPREAGPAVLAQPTQHDPRSLIPDLDPNRAIATRAPSRRGCRSSRSRRHPPRSRRARRSAASLDRGARRSRRSEPG